MSASPISSFQKRSRPDLEESMNAQDGDFTPPPPKKQRLSVTQQNIDANANSNQSTQLQNGNDDECVSDVDKMEIDEIEVIKPFKKDNKALILFSGSVSNSIMDKFCAKAIKQNQFEIISRKHIETKRDKLEEIFLDGISSTIDISDMIEIGMFDEFISSKSLTLMLVSYDGNDADDIYQQLNIWTKTYFLQSIHQIYVTLNYMDYLVKYQSLIGDNNHYKMFNDINMNETANQTEADCLWEVIDPEQQSDQVECCCIPITMYSKPKYAATYTDYIERYGLNQMAKQCYQRAIERGCSYMNVVLGALIMETLWDCLGDVVHHKIDRFKVANYECYHCLKVLYLKQNERKPMIQIMSKQTKKSKKNADRTCEICNVEVPSSDKNWEQHINGKKHKKKALKQQNK